MLGSQRLPLLSKVRSWSWHYLGVINKAAILW